MALPLPTAIKKIRENFLNDYSFVRAGNEFFKHGEPDNAIGEYKQALKLNPNNVQAHRKMGFLLYNVKGKVQEGMAHLKRALELDPDNAFVNHDIGMALLHQKKFEQAIEHLSQALRRMPQGVDKQYNAFDMNYNLGRALFYIGEFKQSEVYFSEALHLDPGNAGLQYELATVLASQGKNDEALSHYSRAVSLKPELAKSTVLHELLASSYAKAGQFNKAVISAERAFNLARAAGNKQLAEQIRKRIEYYRQQAVSERLERFK